MNVALFLSDLHRRGIRLSADGDRLRCQAPAGTLTTTVTEELRRYKQEILAFLGAAQAVVHHPAIVPLQAHGTRPPVFGIAGHNGDVFAYREFAEALGADQPFFGLQPPGLDIDSAPMQTVEQLAGYFVDQIIGVNRRGPHIIAGYCAGGTVAFELARQLAERGERVAFVAMFGCPYPKAFSWRSRISRRVRDHVRQLAALEKPADRRRYVVEFAMRRTTRTPPAPPVTDPVLLRRTALEEVTLAAVLRYRPRPFGGRINLFLPNQTWGSDYRAHRWNAYAADVHRYEGPSDCDMPTMLRSPFSAVFASFFNHASARV